MFAGRTHSVAFAPSGQAPFVFPLWVRDRVRPYIVSFIFCCLPAPAFPEGAVFVERASPAFAVSAAGAAAPFVAFVLRCRFAAPCADVPGPVAAGVAAAPAVASGIACPAAVGICGQDQDCRCWERMAAVWAEGHWGDRQSDHLRRLAAHLRLAGSDCTAPRLRGPELLRGIPLAEQ